jgi:hypothetical protein
MKLQLRVRVFCWPETIHSEMLPFREETVMGRGMVCYLKSGTRLLLLSGTQRLWKLKLKVKLVLFEINLIFPFETTIRLVVLFGI